MNISQRGFLIQNNKTIHESVAGKNPNLNIDNNFSNLLQNKVIESKPLQFSKHANMRLSARNIKLSDEQLGRINDGVNNANKKGINDSLVLVDDIALVINVKNKVVITAMSDEKNSIFTNINGAVIV